jgi:hypothetical protein
MMWGRLSNLRPIVQSAFPDFVQPRRSGVGNAAQDAILPHKSIPVGVDPPVAQERSVAARVFDLAGGRTPLRSLARISWTFEPRKCTIPSRLTVPMSACVRSTPC